MTQQKKAPTPQREIPQPAPVAYFVNGMTNTRLLDEDARDWAKKLRGVTATQLRRFYEHVLALRRRMETLDNQQSTDAAKAFERIRPEFKLMLAKAAYASGRDPKSQAMQHLLQFVVDHVTAVKSRKDFDVFVKHFEAVMGFHKFFAEEKRG